jgi:16S rRNA (adenine1518-N6/adenine1519-N6)-dimethyltransferase
MRRKFGSQLGCDEKLFKLIVKTSFNQRRKTLRNSLKSVTQGNVDTSSTIWDKRPEQLGVDAFVELTNVIGNAR